MQNIREKLKRKLSLHDKNGTPTISPFNRYVKC